MANNLSAEKKTRVVAALTEGCSVRATERLTEVNRETILSLTVRMGEGCRRLMDGMLRNLSVSIIELDEQWSFVGCKQKNVKAGETERGDAWLFIALDATSKAVLSWRVGKRTGETTKALATDLQARLLTRPQITADGFVPYVNAIEDAFGSEVDFAQLVKVYRATPGNDAATRYSPGSILGVEKKTICGDPDESVISTSYVERFNLSTRMHMRRFTRLTNAFSKKLDNHAAAIALHIAYYNLCRMHEAIRCTPAMALGITDHPWTIGELVNAALNASAPTPLPTPPALPKGLSASAVKGERHGGPTKRLYVIRGGKGGKK